MGESEGRREGKEERNEGRRERSGESENWQSTEGKEREGQIPSKKARKRSKGCLRRKWKGKE